jgi:phenylacetate-CoA ligase
MLAALFQLKLSQWWHPEQLAAHQLQQLRSLVAFAVQQVPHYRSLIGAALPAVLRDPRALTWENFADWPILDRAGLRDYGANLLAANLPQDHGGKSWMFTAGSTGAPLRCAVTTVAHFFRSALLMRGQFWHDLDFALTMAEIRPGLASGGAPGWGAAPNVAYPTGPSVTLPASTDTDAQLDWLIARSPGYLASTASNLRALLLRSRETGRVPHGLDALLSSAEPLAPDLRQLARELWGTRVIDTYSCAEAGVLALQCPRRDHFHVQAETAIVEILDEAGRACAPGQTGRVVVTDLVNFGMPLIRYAPGDYAEAGAPCDCGRGLPVLTRIAGRGPDGAARAAAGN